MSTTDPFYTYLWLREDGTPYYVGKGTNNRAYVRHRMGNAPPKDRVILQEHPSEQDAWDAEMFLIDYYGRKDLGTGCLINRTDGGEGGGVNPSEATREKQRTSHLGHKASTETRQRMSRSQVKRCSGGENHWTRKPGYEESIRKMSAARMGRTLSDETKAKISAARLGHETSEETRMKISAANQGKHPWTEERRKLHVQQMKGTKYHLGHSHSEETKQLIRQASTKWWAARKQAGSK